MKPKYYQFIEKMTDLRSLEMTKTNNSSTINKTWLLSIGTF